MTLRNACFIIPLLLVLTFSQTVSGQEPKPSYFYEPTTDLPWAECYIYFDNGSKQRFASLPVISGKVAPFGTNKYSDLEAGLDAFIEAWNGQFWEQVYGKSLRNWRRNGFLGSREDTGRNRGTVPTTRGFD